MTVSISPRLASAASRTAPGSLCDVVGIGFGPSNLSLAIALEECAARRTPVRARFVERKPQFLWHPGMLLPAARAQVPFLKDLVTLRNPRSRYSYLSWLQQRGLLFEFINLRRLTPTRLELNEYFRWAAGHFEESVDYGHEVVGIAPGATRQGRVETLDVRVRRTADGHTRLYRSRNLVVATGGEPSIPDGARAALGERVFHSHEFIPRLARLAETGARSRHVVVIGSGQSAGDVVDHLMNTDPELRISVVVRGFAFRPLDESPFVNELFAPRMTDGVFDMDGMERNQLLGGHRYANYAAVSAELLDRLYENIYRETLLGRDRVEILRFSRLDRVDADGDRVCVRIGDVRTGATQQRIADAVILATGYRRSSRHPLLQGLGAHLETTAGGEYVVRRNYTLATTPGFRPQIFMQGFSEEQHGLSDTLLSVIAVRGGEIADALLRGQRVRRPSTGRCRVPALAPEDGDLEREAGGTLPAGRIRERKRATRPSRRVAA